MGAEVRKFRPVPSNLKRMRRGARAKAGDLRIYAQVTTMEGKKKRISFRVGISERLMRYRRDLMKLIRATCNNILDKQVPIHKYGERFPSFTDLFKRRWVRVRKVHWYKAGVVYER